MQEKILTRMDGMRFKKDPDGPYCFTIHVDSLIQWLNKHKNERGFVDGVIHPRRQPTEKVTHLPLAYLDKVVPSKTESNE
jgi:hypothetical protein